MKKLIKSKLFLQVIVASMVATLATVGIVGAVTTIGENINTGGTLAAGATTITGALSASTQIGVASTSPLGILSVEQGTETYSFVVGNTGSSTPSIVVLGVNGNGRIGIASSTPSARLSVGASTAATTTVDFAKPCFRMTTDSGTTLYYWPSLADGVLGGWATSTVSCF